MRQTYLKPFHAGEELTNVPKATFSVPHELFIGPVMRHSICFVSEQARLQLSLTIVALLLPILVDSRVTTTALQASIIVALLAKRTASIVLCEHFSEHELPTTTSPPLQMIILPQLTH